MSRLSLGRLAWLFLVAFYFFWGRLGRAEELTVQAQAILRTHCAACHGPGGTAKGGFDYLLDRDRLVARNQVVPGEAEESPLLQRIEQGEMPPGKRPRPNPTEVAVLRRWIESGASAFRPAVSSPSFTSETGLVQILLADLQALEPRQRRFTRYLTLTHLANAGVTEDELALHRQALAKLVNSLSWHPRIQQPHAVDAGRTVYRLDLRDYRWTPRMWERLAAVYPYRPAEVRAAARTCTALAGSEQPHLRGDWFVATASRPPFYHDFLQLPATDRALERILQVDVLANLQDDNAVRAGFNGSGVARNNRILERHDALHGAYWRSYDFSDNTGRQNIFERPLGPSPGPHAFVAAGGEIIFNLPNGLQAYLLVDAQGRRVDKAAGDIVSDPKRPDRLVENGLSCMSCHVAGLLPKDDQVRAHLQKNASAFAEDDRATILALYPQTTRLRNFMKEDVQRFARALKQAGVPEGEPEPVSTVTLRYEAVVDVRSAAAESGLNLEEFTQQLRRTPVLLRSLGPLGVRGGTVQRQVFEESYPGLARAFRVGTSDPTEEMAPVRPTLLQGHKDSVCDIAFAADGRSVVSASEDKTIRMWDLGSGAERRHCVGHTDEVSSVALTTDGRYILSGSRDRSVRLWDARTGEEIRRFPGHTDIVRAVAVSADGKQGLSAGADRTVRLWDLNTGREKCCLTGHGGPVTCIAFAPDARLALSGGQDRTVRLWDLTAGREKACWPGHTAAVYSVAFSPDGRRALSGGADGVMRLWDVARGEEVRPFAGHANTIVRVAFRDDGRQVLSGSSQYRTAAPIVRVWEVDGGEEVARLEGADLGRVNCLAFARDGSQVLVSLSGGVLRLIPLTTRR
jgi:WD40 repeat protein/mono/diheme cytochrome c family protein